VRAKSVFGLPSVKGRWESERVQVRGIGKFEEVSSNVSTCSVCSVCLRIGEVVSCTCACSRD